MELPKTIEPFTLLQGGQALNGSEPDSEYIIDPRGSQVTRVLEENAFADEGSVIMTHDNEKLRFVSLSDCRN